MCSCRRPCGAAVLSDVSGADQSSRRSPAANSQVRAYSVPSRLRISVYTLRRMCHSYMYSPVFHHTPSAEPTNNNEFPRRCYLLLSVLLQNTPEQHLDHPHIKDAIKILHLGSSVSLFVFRVWLSESFFSLLPTLSLHLSLFFVLCLSCLCLYLCLCLCLCPCLCVCLRLLSARWQEWWQWHSMKC